MRCNVFYAPLSGNISGYTCTALYKTIIIIKNYYYYAPTLGLTCTRPYPNEAIPSLRHTLFSNDSHLYTKWTRSIVETEFNFNAVRWDLRFAHLSKALSIWKKYSNLNNSHWKCWQSPGIVFLANNSWQSQDHTYSCMLRIIFEDASSTSH